MEGAAETVQDDDTSKKRSRPTSTDLVAASFQPAKSSSVFPSSSVIEAQKAMVSPSMSELESQNSKSKGIAIFELDMVSLSGDMESELDKKQKSTRQAKQLAVDQTTSSALNEGGKEIKKKLAVEMSSHLHHRLFGLSDSPAKKKSGVRHSTKHSHESGEEVLTKKQKLSLETARVSEERAPPGGSVTCNLEMPEKVVIRGSITHKVLQKLGRVDLRRLRDYHLPNQSCQKEDGDQSPEKPDFIEHSRSSPQADDTDAPNASATQATSVCDKKPVSAESSDVMTSLGATARSASQCSHSTKSHDAAADEPPKPPRKLRMCFRSFVLPQKSPNTSKESHRVVILHGPNKGQTGALFVG